MPIKHDRSRSIVMRRLQLASASSLLALAAYSAAYAGGQTSPESGSTAVEEVVVTGLRGSLQRNLDAKRSASGVVDVISAEDIGKFP